VIGALPIVDRLNNELENEVGRLKSKELEALLRWKGVPVLTVGNVANKCILYQKFAEGGADVSQYSVRYEYLLWACPAKARH